MIVETVKREIQRSNTFQERAMGLAVGSESFVFNVLRKDLYSDPIGSLIREYTVNAQDEHRKHGKTDVPISIQVPNHFSPELRIRDYAGGLTEEQVFEFFGNYGASDKRDSNVAVGFFGLGCKSAFAYTDSYIVKSFKDGMEYTFNIYIDETEIGKTALLSAEPTTEPNGVEIIVPVKTYDINTFAQKVVSTVKYFKTKPTITGMAEAPVFNNKTAVIKGDGWEFFGNGTPTVIMGEIPYPIDYYKMPQNMESWESNLLRSELTIQLSIGDVQVTASREALQMSPKTIDAIRAKLKDIKDLMIEETIKVFADAKNIIEAKELYNSVMNGGGYSNVIRNCGKDLIWNGQVIDDSIVRFDRNLHHVITYSQTRGGMIRTDYSPNLQCKKGNVIYFDDTDKAQVGYKRRARTLLNAGANQVIVLSTTDEKELETFLGMSVKDLESFNAVTPTVAQSSRAGGTGVDLTKRAKHASKVFVLNVDKIKLGVYGAASEYWEVKEVDNLDGVYVPIDRFKPIFGRIYDLSSLASMIEALEGADIAIDVPIYGIKTGGDTSGLVRFDVWANSKIKENTQLIDDYSTVLAFGNYGLHDVSELRTDNLPDGSVAKTYATMYNEARKLYSVSGKFNKVFKYSDVEVKANKTISELSDKFSVKYPMLKLVSDYNLGDPLVTEYIAEMEGVQV